MSLTLEQGIETETEISRLRNVLGRISRWFGEFPETGKCWDHDKTRPVSYAAWYGTTGERDYMRKVASDALNHVYTSVEDHCIRVWPWDKAPPELKAVWPNTGDEDWLALVPPAYADKWISWLDSGSEFGVCSVHTYPHPRLVGYEIRIGTHS